MKRSLALLIPFACLMWAACDTQHVDPDACPAAPATDGSDYFPLAVGQTRTFTYSFLIFSPTTTRTEGEITWHVLSANACAFGEQAFLVEERLTGQRRVTNLYGFDSTYQETRTRKISFAVDDSLVYLGPYFDRGLPRVHPHTASDTLKFDADDPQSIYGFDNNNGWRASVQVVRNKGLISRSFFYHGGVQYDVYEDLVLKDE